MLDLFTAAAAGKVDDGGRKSFMKQATEQLDEILDMASPFTEGKKKAKTPTFTMEQKLELLSKANASKDKSVEGMLKAMSEAAENIAEKAK